MAQDWTEAWRWEQRAAEQRDPNAQYGLAVLYAKGQAVGRNYGEAFRWFRKAAERGYPLRFDFESGCTVGSYAEVPNRRYLVELVRDGDEIGNWRELLTVQIFPPSVGCSPQDVLNELKALRERECPGATRWNIVAKDETSILYEWQAKPCLSWRDQHEIAKIIHGKRNTIVLHYTVKTYQMAADQRTNWVRRFSEAR